MIFIDIIVYFFGSQGGDWNENGSKQKQKVKKEISMANHFTEWPGDSGSKPAQFQK